MGQVRITGRDEKKIYFPEELNYGLHKDKKYRLYFTKSLSRKYIVLSKKYLSNKF